MLVVTGTFKLDAIDIEAMKKAASIMAAETRDESGCITYAFWQDIEDDTRFRVYEEWLDQAALDLHFATPHMTRFRAVLAGCQPIQRDVVKFMAGEVTPL